MGSPFAQLYRVAADAPEVRVALGPAATFFVFCGVCAAGFAFVLLCVPETKGKSLEDIEALFR